MHERLTPLGLFMKWVVAPLLLALLGYFLLGPTLGHVNPPAKTRGPQVDIDVNRG
jgi:hypothetical protein